MAASTRSGLPGGFSGGNGPTDVQSARTLYGHDLHLNRGELDAGAVRDPAPETPSRPVTQEEEFAPEPTDSLRGRSGKSRFPALAKLFGRWNTRGQFEPRYAEDDDLDTVPRERLLRPLAIVVATAAISFFIVVGLLKLRDSTSTAPEPEPVAQPLVSPPVTSPPPPAPRAQAAAPVPAPRPVVAVPAAPAAPARTRPLSEVLERALAQREAPRAAAKRPIQRRPRARMVVPADPDSPMPLSF
jgi:hypothetical protein